MDRHLTSTLTQILNLTPYRYPSPNPKGARRLTSPQTPSTRHSKVDPHEKSPHAPTLPNLWLLTFALTPSLIPNRICILLPPAETEVLGDISTKTEPGPLSTQPAPLYPNSYLAALSPEVLGDMNRANSSAARQASCPVLPPQSLPQPGSRHHTLTLLPSAEKSLAT